MHRAEGRSTPRKVTLDLQLSVAHSSAASPGVHAAEAEPERAGQQQHRRAQHPPLGRHGRRNTLQTRTIKTSCMLYQHGKLNVALKRCQRKPPFSSEARTKCWVRNDAKRFKAVLSDLLVQRNQEGKRQRLQRLNLQTYAYTKNKLVDEKSLPPGAEGTKECNTCSTCMQTCTCAIYRRTSPEVLRHPPSCPALSCAWRGGPGPKPRGPRAKHCCAAGNQFSSVHTRHGMHDRRCTKCWCSK